MKAFQKKKEKNDKAKKINRKISLKINFPQQRKRNENEKEKPHAMVENEKWKMLEEIEI